MLHLLPLAFLSLSGDLAAPSEAPDLRPAFASFVAEHGVGWRLLADPETGWLQMLSGGRARPAFRPRIDADFESLARTALATTVDLHGIDAETLVLDRVLFLPLGQIGSVDKMTVRFREVVGGVPVVGGYVNALFAVDGTLLSIQSTGLAHLAGFGTVPATSSRAALEGAARFFRERAAAATRASEPLLVVDQKAGADGRRRPRLCWQVDLARIVAGFEPEGSTIWIDARTGEFVRSERNIKNLDVGGTVSSLASPGMNPDTATNLPTAQPMKYLVVESSAGTVFTDANGQFNFPGVNGPLACRFRYIGLLNSVGNAAGADYDQTFTLATGNGNSVLMNPSGAAAFTAQANAFATVDKQRDWVRSINPAEDRLDFVHIAIVNLGQTCNAYYDGFEINFFASGGGCPNTAYSTVVSHEDGHWANDVFGTGNGGDGMGEGNADTWAEYVWDTPVVAAGFFGPGTVLRDGRNTRPFCGDCCGGCYGEVHTDGEVWMGTAWKVRARLVASNGAAGRLAADTLFLSWMEAYNQGQIKSVIETQWLTLDDVDGNIDNGTPHYTDIDLGFQAQSFPGVVLKPVSYGAVTDVGDSVIQSHPATVAAVIHANVAPPATALVRYRVNGGPFQDVAMQDLGGDHFSAAIPGQFAPAHVEYYVTATDVSANTATYPANAPNGLLDYDIGAVHVLRFDDFDLSGDLGWTHGSYGDSSNPADDWIRTFPGGDAGVAGGIAWSDPPQAFSGIMCWGNGLGQGANNGAYPANVHEFLRSPAIDCSGAVHTQLRFKRWLTVEGSAHDQARIRVNGVPVFANPAAPLVDTGWTNQTIDVSALADGNASVQFEFELASDGANQFGGWQIDDFELQWVGVPACPTPTNTCYQTSNSADGVGAQMDSSGTAVIPSNDLVLRTFGCPARKKGLYLYSRGEAASPYGNGVLCLASPVLRLSSVVTDATGHASLPLDLHHLPNNGQIAAGETWHFQFLFRDPAAGGAGFNTSDSLTVTFCP